MGTDATTDAKERVRKTDREDRSDPEAGEDRAPTEAAADAPDALEPKVGAEVDVRPRSGTSGRSDPTGPLADAGTGEGASGGRDEGTGSRAVEIERCPECGSDHLVRDEREDLVCERCGLVLEESSIDPGPDWRSFNPAQEEERARTGAPATFTLHDKGLTTVMGWPGRDARGKQVPAASRAQLYRMRRWNRRLRMATGAEQNMAHALGELRRMAGAMSLPRPVQETASVIYRRAMKEDLVKGRSIESVAAASMYAACRKLNIPRTLDEVADVAHVPKKAMARAYRALSRELGLKLQPTTPMDYVSRFASDLDLGPEARARAIEILKEATEEGLAAGKAPTGLTGAALYLSARETGDARTQEQVAEVSGVSEVTLRNRAKELESAGISR